MVVLDCPGGLLSAVLAGLQPSRSECCLWDWGDVWLVSALGQSCGDMQARLEEDFFMQCGYGCSNSEGGKKAGVLIILAKI